MFRHTTTTPGTGTSNTDGHANAVGSDRSPAQQPPQPSSQLPSRPSQRTATTQVPHRTFSAPPPTPPPAAATATALPPASPSSVPSRIATAAARPSRALPRQSSLHATPPAISKLLEVAAANELTLDRLVTMVDDFDHRLRALEEKKKQQQQQQQQKEKSPAPTAAAATTTTTTTTTTTKVSASPHLLGQDSESEPELETERDVYDHIQNRRRRKQPRNST